MRLVFFLFAVFSVGASVLALPLDPVAELEAVVSDLEATQTQTVLLRERLAELENLTTNHEMTLALQSEQLLAYRDSVTRLEAHDRATLRLLAWLGPLAATAVTVAAVETLLLLLGGKK